MTTPAWVCACVRRLKKICRFVASVVRAHKIACAGALVGVFGGVLGLCAGCAAGIFAELIIRRLREEKTAPQQDPADMRDALRAPQEEAARAAACATLELPPDASPDDIKTAHRRLAAQYHPDGEHGDSEKFLEIQAAYERLMQ